MIIRLCVVPVDVNERGSARRNGRSRLHWHFTEKGNANVDGDADDDDTQNEEKDLLLTHGVLSFSCSESSIGVHTTPPEDPLNP